MIRLLSFVFGLCLFTFASYSDSYKVLCLGDSLTEGYGVSKASAYPAKLKTKLNEKGLDVEVINAGVSGSTTASGLSRLRWALKAKAKPDILIIALGANDGLRGQPVENSKENLRKIIQYAKSQGLKVLLAGMKLPKNYGKAYTSEFQDMFSDLATTEKLTFMPFLLEGVAAESSLNLPDGIHPNAKGHEVIASNLLVYLLPLLKT